MAKGSSTPRKGATSQKESTDAPKAKKSAIEEERTIEFFVVRQLSADHPAFNADTLLKEIQKIPEDKRFITIESNKEEFDCWPSTSEHLYPFRIGITRSRVRGGKVNLDTRKLSGYSLPERHEQSEYSHLIIFPDNFVGFEFNPAGPRLSQFSEFLDKAVSQLGFIRFEPVASKDFETNLRNVPRFTSFSMTITQANAELYGQLDPDYVQARKAELERSGAQRMRVIFYPERKIDSMRSFVEGFARKIMKQPDPKDAMKKLALKFEGEKADAVKRKLVNLLAAKITKKKTIALATPISEKRLDHDAAYKAIREAYDDMLPVLKEGVTTEIDL